MGVLLEQSFFDVIFWCSHNNLLAYFQELMKIFLPFPNTWLETCKKIADQSTQLAVMLEL
jgi:hypothetical protein